MFHDEGACLLKHSGSQLAFYKQNIIQKYFKSVFGILGKVFVVIYMDLMENLCF